MKIINDYKPNANFIQHITSGQVFTVDTYNFYIKVSDREPIGYGVDEYTLKELCDQIENNYLGVDLATGEVVSFARNTAVIPVPNFVGRIENEVLNA